MDPARKHWNVRQKELRKLLSDPLSIPQAIDVFLQQHAEVHASAMSSAGSVSFEDEILADLEKSQLRIMPDRMEHSIAWILWHLARIEDVTMNILVAGEEQLFVREGWGERLGISIQHTGNAMSRNEIIKLSNEIDVDELRQYRTSVGRETDQIVKDVVPEEMGQKVSSTRIQMVREVGAVVAEAEAILNYWSKRSIAGLLLMPPTRHCFIHLNEAAKVRKRIK
jgi:hypothetical protein